MNLTPGQTLVISMSSGKDSTATALHLLESGVLDRHIQQGGEVRRVFLDTGWELDETYDYLDRVLVPRFGRIDRAALWVPGPGEAPPDGYDHLEPLWVTPGKTMAADRWALARVFETRMRRYSPMVRLILHKAIFAASQSRWCTDETKRRVVRGYLDTCADPVNALGLRAEESPARAALEEVEFNASWDCWLWRPILSWTREDVIAIHNRHGIAPNPLYLQGAGAGRVGCGPCVHTGRQDMRWLLDQHPDRLDLLADIERVVADIEDAPWRGKFDPPKWFQLPRQRKVRRVVTDAEDEPILDGDGGPVMTEVLEVVHACVPVAEYAAWALSEPRKGKQVAMFPNHEPPGCSIWGLCEVPQDFAPEVPSTQPATDADAALVAAAIARHGSQKATERATGVPQHRLSRASVAGQGRALSASMRERLA